MAQVTTTEMCFKGSELGFASKAGGTLNLLIKLRFKYLFYKTYLVLGHDLLCILFPINMVYFYLLEFCYVLSAIIVD